MCGASGGNAILLVVPEYLEELECVCNTMAQDAQEDVVKRRNV